MADLLARAQGKARCARDRSRHALVPAAGLAGRGRDLRAADEARVLEHAMLLHETSDAATTAAITAKRRTAPMRLVSARTTSPLAPACRGVRQTRCANSSSLGWSHSRCRRRFRARPLHTATSRAARRASPGRTTAAPGSVGADGDPRPEAWKRPAEGESSSRWSTPASDFHHLDLRGPARPPRRARTCSRTRRSRVLPWHPAAARRSRASRRTTTATARTSPGSSPRHGQPDRCGRCRAQGAGDAGQGARPRGERRRP